MAPHPERPCVGHQDVVTELTEIRSTLFGSKGDSRGGLVSLVEKHDQSILETKRTIWIAMGGLLVINNIVVLVVLPLLIWWVTKPSIRQGEVNALVRQYFSQFHKPKQDQL